MRPTAHAIDTAQCRMPMLASSLRAMSSVTAMEPNYTTRPWLEAAIDCWEQCLATPPAFTVRIRRRPVVHHVIIFISEMVRASFPKVHPVHRAH